MFLDQSRYSTSFNIRASLFTGLCVVGLVVMLRLTLVCASPSTDEGFYALYAMLAYNSISAGDGLPQIGVLNLYPALCSFIFSWQINHIIALRLCDMFIASLVAWQLFRLLEQESGSTLIGGIITVIFALAVNQPLFIQSGFKNAAFMAWLCLIPAMRIGLCITQKNHKAYFLCGVLTCLGIFFRESFFPFALFGFISLLFYRGFRAAWLYVLGGVSVGITLIAILVFARGGIGNIIDAYRMFKNMALELGSRTSNTLYNLDVSAVEVRFLLPLAFFALIACFLGMREKKLHFARIAFWLGIALIPLSEVMSKGGYPYHFSFCLYGFAGLIAYIAGYVNTKSTILKVIGLGIVLISMVWVCILSFPQPQKIVRAISEISRMLPHQKWPQEMVDSSNYLLMAEAITKNSRQGSSMEVTGAYMLLHVLTQRMPPITSKNHLFDLALFAMVNGYSVEDIKDYLIKTDIIVLSERPGFNTEVVREVLEQMPEYVAIKYIGASNERHYGGFTAIIFIRKQ